MPYGWVYFSRLLAFLIILWSPHNKVIDLNKFFIIQAKENF